MSDGAFIADTLESLIVGMAESLREAQEELSATPPLDGFGRPVPQYRIPYLDFEIGFRLVTETKSSGGMRLIFAPVTSSEAAREVTSRITGRFVSIPPGEGLPLPVLSAQITGSGAERELRVTAATTAGELLAGAEVQLNVEVAASTALSQAAGITNPRIAGEVGFGAAVLTTGEDGTAITTITFGAGLQSNARVVVTAELGPEMIRLTTGKGIG
ncbi:hypothetical protein [Roseitranquillus sediminis]|uniref:hypothetical protein n=1 Tax=Roseitranquillus sediminis TaxID=2809051 RepID=UPI001D0C13AB|nr:hypothetical protein [Roseitranquillus sediminis]MBM9593570.1 hypothetical protein [Roseitranquillus sediminis]